MCDVARKTRASPRLIDSEVRQSDFEPECRNAFYGCFYSLRTWHVLSIVGWSKPVSETSSTGPLAAYFRKPASIAVQLFQDLGCLLKILVVIVLYSESGCF